jgi:hypothetical protein
VVGVAETAELEVVEPADTPVVTGTKNKSGGGAACTLLLHYCDHLGIS